MTTPTTTETSLDSNLAQMASRASGLHLDCIKRAKQAVTAALECGFLLVEVHGQLSHSGTIYGNWGPFLEKAEIPRQTAHRYMKLAVAFKERGQILEGAKLCDLYREFGLLPPNLGEGNRNPERARQLREEDQMCFHFDIMESAFKEVARYAEKTGHTNPFESLDRPTLATTREQLTKVLALVDEALAAN